MEGSESMLMGVLSASEESAEGPVIWGADWSGRMVDDGSLEMETWESRSLRRL
jgi:hypothetical protein